MPLGLNIEYGSKRHNKIVEAVRARWQQCKIKAGDQFDKWTEAEDRALAYLKVSEKDAKRKQERKDGKPNYVTIDIPYSYAQMLAAHTYESSVFLSRTPIHQFEGRHSESEGSVDALEAIIDYQTTVGRMVAPYYIWLMDKRKYGCGILGTYWDKEINQTVEIVEQQSTWAGLSIGPKRKVRQVRRTVGYEGNKVFNIRPTDFIFDTRVPLSRFQEGEYAGYYNEVGWNEIARRADSDEYMNTDILAKTQSRDWWRSKEQSQLKVANQEDVATEALDFRDPTKNLGIVSQCNMVVELIPKDWELGPSDYPEKWLFIVGNDKVLLQARPLGLLHNRFPFDVLENEIEGYGMFKRGMQEVLQPLNDTLTWLFNTHFYNVRRVINDQLIADPSRVVISDLEDPDKGRIIRLKPEAYGQDIRTVVGQLQVVDITQNHLKDSAVVMDLLQRLGGVNEGIMGILDPAGRKTATEVRQAGGAGIGRMKTEAEFASAQGWASHAMKLVQNTQQFYTGMQEYRVAGSLMMGATRLVTVTPEAIAGFFDWAPVDGTLPVDRYAQAALWKELLQGMAQIPSLMMQYDLGRIFSHVAMLAGVKDVDRFRLNVAPDQVLQNQMEMGNVIPLGGRSGAAGSNRGAAGGTTGTPGVAQIPGLGPTL